MSKAQTKPVAKRSPGRPPAKGGTMVGVHVRLPAALLDRIDAEVDAVARTYARADRSTVIRAVLVRGLDKNR